MKKRIVKIAVLLLGVGVFAACGSNSSSSKEETKNEVEETVVSLEVDEPNEFFEEATSAFLKGNKVESSEQVDKSIDALKELKKDFKNETPIDKQITALEVLSKNIKADKVKNVSELQKVFQETYHALAGHSLLITETYIEMDAPEQAKKATHSAKYYLKKAEKNAIQSSKHIYKESINEMDVINKKTETEFKKDVKEVKQGVSKTMNFLKKIDENLEGGGE